MELLATMTTHVPEGTSEETVDEVRAREAAHSPELATQRHLLRLWRPPLQPGELRGPGLWRAPDAAAMTAILESLPLHAWLSAETTPLTTHPNDPAAD